MDMDGDKGQGHTKSTYGIDVFAISRKRRMELGRSMIRYEVVDEKGNRIALCNSMRLAESYQRANPGSKIIERKGIIKGL